MRPMKELWCWNNEKDVQCNATVLIKKMICTKCDELNGIKIIRALLYARHKTPLHPKWVAHKLGKRLGNSFTEICVQHYLSLSRHLITWCSLTKLNSHALSAFGGTERHYQWVVRRWSTNGVEHARARTNQATDRERENWLSCVQHF